MQINITDLVTSFMIENVVIQERANQLYSCSDLESIKSTLRQIRSRADKITEIADDELVRINAGTRN
jgi:hypothetical protein